MRRSASTSSTSTGTTRSPPVRCSRMGDTDMRAAVFSLLVAAGTANACGYCVEDKIAATYDHAVVTAALAKAHQVAFFHVEGHLPAGEPGRRLLERAASGTPGVDAGTVRVSEDNLTLSLAFDPARS